MDQYKDVIDKLLALCEEAAKLTGNTWDDQIARVAHEIFDRWFGIVHSVKARPDVFGAANVESRFTLTEAEERSLPPWLAQVIKALIRVLPYLI